MTTNRMGLTPKQSANSFTDDDLRSMITGNNPQSNAWRELLACRAASEEPVAWIVHARGGDQLTRDGDYVANAEGMGSIHSTPLYAAPPLQAVRCRMSSMFLLRQVALKLLLKTGLQRIIFTVLAGTPAEPPC